MTGLPADRVLRIAFDLLDQVSTAPDREHAVRAFLEGAQKLIPCDLAAANSVHPATRAMRPLFLGASPWPDPASMLTPYVYSHPLIRHYAAHRDPQARRTTDVCTARQWFAAPAYRHVFAAQGLRYQLGFGRAGPSGRLDGITLSRSSSDFTDAERELMSLLVDRVRRRGSDLLTTAAGPPGTLTSRERQICDLMAAGRSPAMISTILGISLRTVEKHLENAYRKLGVRSNLAAAAAIRANPGA